MLKNVQLKICLGFVGCAGVGILRPVRYKKNVIILKNVTILNRKKSVAYRHSGLRPGIQYKNALFAKWCFLDSGSKPGMTVCHRLLTV